MLSRANFIGAVLFLAAGVIGFFLPPWLVSLLTIAFANALVVLGLIILWRAGLVPFGQALYYCSGAYTVALLARWVGISDAFVLLIASGIVAGIVAFLTGFLLARYREIFFAMLSLAMSMILYGILVKTETLGSTDGFGVDTPSFLGYAPHREALGFALYWFVLAVCAVAAMAIGAYFKSVAGALAQPIRDNEIRVEFLGISVTRLIHMKLVVAGTLAGVGGALAAMTIGHVDPNMSYWTTSGGFVFVTILAGAGSVAAAFVGSLVFEIVRSFAFAVLPGFWQMTLGIVLLLTILFLPEGLGSLATRLRRRRPTTEQASKPVATS